MNSFFSTAKLLFETATLRSGFALSDQVGFAERIENVLKSSMDIAQDAEVEQEEEISEDVAEDEPVEEVEADDEEGKDELWAHFLPSLVFCLNLLFFR